MTARKTSSSKAAPTRTARDGSHFVVRSGRDGKLERVIATPEEIEARAKFLRYAALKSTPKKGKAITSAKAKKIVSDYFARHAEDSSAEEHAKNNAPA
ncbi:MAG: hypothetical protein HC850_07135 [Rhodomicrobium sp.]|nr:hypothetical protein [Rhodomicrobium sp.]